MTKLGGEDGVVNGAGRLRAEAGTLQDFPLGDGPAKVRAARRSEGSDRASMTDRTKAQRKEKVVQE